eukprot:TRINITY_DN63122_c0_g1_i1.p2 TRINITY_DN63122_c0_g1~~TRINITY_DN63122_c0_g1_i1.p2  ORF type:complete len:289 (+),score=38.54 TRINITY_DN63122_c0_g1_i1:49-915(+)
MRPQYDGRTRYQAHAPPNEEPTAAKVRKGVLPILPDLEGEGKVVEPMVWFSKDKRKWCEDRGIPESQIAQLPAWVSQSRVSLLLFGRNGENHIWTVQRATNSNFVWAPEFANVHSTWDYAEKPFKVGSSGDREWWSVEHYFQCMKSKGTPSHDKALQAFQKYKNPMDAFQLGRSFGLRSDWESVKEAVMEEGVRAKFDNCKDLQELLLKTGKHKLVQIKPTDECWGTGKLGLGKNLLGVILEKIRSELQAQQEPAPQPTPQLEAPAPPAPPQEEEKKEEETTEQTALN